MGRGGSDIRTFKDNFWSLKRVEANVTIRELAETIGIKETTLGSYFTGQSMPKQEIVYALCDWFGVEYIKGEREFLKAHKAYDAQRNGKKVKATANRGIGVISEEIKPITVVPVVKVDNSDVIKAEKKMAINKAVYGKVSCELYNHIYEAGVDNVLKTVYGIVDYSIYNTIENILSASVTEEDNKWEI